MRGLSDTYRPQDASTAALRTPEGRSALCEGGRRSWPWPSKDSADRRRELWHPSYKPTRVLVLDERQTDTDMSAALLRAGQMLRHFVETHVAVNDLEKKLNWALQPDMQAPDAGRFDDDAIVQVSQGRVFEPGHQKSSAEGMRL